MYLRFTTSILTLLFFQLSFSPLFLTNSNKNTSIFKETVLHIQADTATGKLEIFRAGEKTPMLTQIAKADFRPYLHPIVAPDGKGILTEYSPGHHKHQTGLYWGYTRVNGRDYFHNPQGDYWRRVSLTVLEEKGTEVKWQTVYDLLDAEGKAVLTETQTWSMLEKDGKYFLDLEWNGEARVDVTIGKYDYGGLFLRMPWKPGIKGEVMNAARQRNEKAEGQRAMWADVGMQVEGRDDLVHIAIFDHPTNKGYPQHWRVDGQLGLGPVRQRLTDLSIPKGSMDLVRHQLVVYTGELNDVEMTKTWGNYTGNNSTYSTAVLWDLARKEGRDARFLNPEEAVAAMTIKEGFQVNAWAGEPMITQPMAFCWDDRGRLWVAENRDYEDRGKGFSNSGDSRIVILEDTDQDGVADSRKVFMEGIAFPAALAVGFDGVYVGAPPNLLFIPDRNHDDKADLDAIEVKLTGWGIRDRHETLNSLHWGPDGWLYGLQGFATPSKVRKPNGKGRLYSHKDPFPEDILEGEGTEINGGVWRYHPTKEIFEVVAHGFSNPWGIDHDAKGQLFITACVIPHLWHVIPGGIYHRQGGQHFNPYVYNDIKTIADHSHRSAHGGARIYQSDAFPGSEKGKIFMANIHEHAVLSDVLVPKGSGFTSHHGEDFMMANNAQWVGFSMEVGPEGGLYVLDWHDADICGSEVVNRETGRIFRIMPKNSAAKSWPNRYANLSAFSDQELVALQTSPSEWHARRARLLLQARAAKNTLQATTHQALHTLFAKETNPDWRLRAFWALHITKGLTANDLQKALADRDPYVRSWAIQFLCEDRAANPEAFSQFSTLARQDASPVVRLYLASALTRVDEKSRWSIAEGLVTHAEDAQDHNLPKMIWFGIEPLLIKNPARALTLASQSKIPMLSQFIARRLVDAEKTELVVAAISKNQPNQLHLLEGMRDALEGRYDVSPPINWKPVQANLAKQNNKSAEIARELSAHFGDSEAARKQIITLKNKTAPTDQRLKALQNLSARQRPELAAELPSLFQESTLRIEAIRAMASYDREAFGKLLLDKYPTLNAAEKREAIQTLASRPAYGWLLTKALAGKTIAKKDVPPYVANQLRRVVGSGFVEVWGPIDHVAFNQTAYISYKKLLTEKNLSTANPRQGKQIFQNTCGPCHKMYGEGGTLGPDITGSNRTNVDYLLSNILDPGGEIQDDYKMVVVTTRDGRTHVGNVAKETDRQLTLRVVGQEAVILNKTDIQSREVTPASMMPTGLFESLSDTEILNLVAYLRTTEAIR
ncbi:PVC-type heme-binding CxxCH protein [Arundinibacter roseus]|uniref:C-type cytochrome n=1 Tax=Arundinibacter roseus TaxID=2070510 RepID=A0A4R4KJ29_9BACT|nr:PVC-type heme-binding CxxCH protein [Arundinibacter roseus]TDB68218.1 c-type cytochrome [Arundinibacter roseus]